MPNVNLLPARNAPIAVWIDVLLTAADRLRNSGVASNFAKATTCRSMATNLRTYNRWASDRQQNYAMDLVRQANSIALMTETREGSLTALARAALGASDSVRRVGEAFIGIDQARSDFLSPPPNETVVEWPVIDDRASPGVPIVSMEAINRIRALFNAALSNNLQRPRIFLRIGPATIILGWDTRNGQVLVMNSRKKVAGVILSSGEFQSRRYCTPEIIAAVQAFGDNPLSVARAHGHRTGNCCFCQRALTDGRSVAEGYGPVCAGNYRLPWGENRLQSTADIVDNGRVASAPVAVVSDVVVQARSTIDRIPMVIRSFQSPLANAIDAQRQALSRLPAPVASAPPLPLRGTPRSRRISPMIRPMPTFVASESMRSAVNELSNALNYPPGLRYDDEDDQFLLPSGTRPRAG